MGQAIALNGCYEEKKAWTGQSGSIHSKKRVFMTVKKLLARAYEVKTLQETERLYDDWAKTYDSELIENGYMTPQRCADVLAVLAEGRAGATIDLGCGTGQCGHALKMAGFDPVDGADYSESMLEVAAQTGCYRALGRCNLIEPLSTQITKGAGFSAPYRNAVAAGVFNPAHTEPTAIAHILEIVAPQGLFVFSLNDHVYADGGYQEAIAEQEAAGAVRTVFKSYGGHIPQKGLNAWVIALQKVS